VNQVCRIFLQDFRHIFFISCLSSLLT
jgi:hypothetical protein